MKDIKLAIIEDDQLIRESLEAAMAIHAGIQVRQIVDSVEAFLEISQQQNKPPLDILLLDIGLPGMNGIQGIRYIRKLYPELDIIMLTTFEEDEMIFNALCAGACSYISKRTSLEKIREAVLTVSKGGSYMSPSIARKIAERFMPKKKKKEAKLSDRQMEIVQALVDGLSYKMIANHLHISIDTVRDHIRRIYRILEVNSKVEVVKKALEGDL